MDDFDYSGQLLRPEWRAFRLKVLERDGNACVVCRGTKRLQAHHKKYEYGKMAWEYPMSNFVTLCENCHSAHHDLQDGEIHQDPDGPLFYYLVRQLDSGMWTVYYKTLGSAKRTIVYECPNQKLAFEARDQLKRQAYRKHKDKAQENIYRIRGY